MGGQAQDLHPQRDLVALPKESFIFFIACITKCILMIACLFVAARLSL